MAQTLVSGLGVGSVYGLIALSISVAYSVTRVINLALAAVAVVAGLASYSLTETLGLPVVVAIPAVVTAAGGLAVLLETVLLRRAAARLGDDRTILVTVGMLQALNGFALVVWGNVPYTARPLSGSTPIAVGGVEVPTQTVWLLGTLLAVVVLVRILLRRTTLGLELRATASNLDAARLCGVRVGVTRAVALGIAFAVAAVAGIMILPLTFVQYDTSIVFAVNGFIAAVLGGLGRVERAAGVGVGLGLLEAGLGRVTDGAMAEVVAVAVLLLVLLVFSRQLVSSQPRRA